MRGVIRLTRAARAGACAVVLATAVAGSARAGIDRAGTTAANFLSVGVGAGLLGMGGAGLGLGRDLAAAAWNPAALARIGRTEVLFSHAALAEASAQDWAGAGGPLPFAGLAGAFTGLIQSEGSIEGRDALNNPTGSFDVSSSAFGFGVARAFGPRVTAGVDLKYASENLSAVRGSGVTFDLGLQARSGAFGFGAAAQNVLGRMSYDGATYDFPASFGLGASYDHAASGVSVALDLNVPSAYSSDLRAGVEWHRNPRFALRAGYRAELGAEARDPLAGPTFGMGAGAHGVWLDYGYLLGGNGAGQHRIGIRFHPGAMGWGGDEDDGAEIPERAPARAASAARAVTAPAPQAATSRPAPQAAPTQPAPQAQATRPTPQAMPTYVQRAKAARDVGNRASGGHKTAATQVFAPPPPKPGVFTPQDSIQRAAGAPAAAKPPAAGAAPAGGPGSAADSSASRGAAVAPAPAATAAPAPAAPARDAKRPAKVKVKQGQTLEDIARLYDTTAAAIMMENNLTSERVRPGQTLRLPRK
ncbi:MAG TPA: PorV/PorQ family protein [Candidatus Eisenbacteria bacterium]|jgi:hypothetical protein